MIYNVDVLSHYSVGKKMQKFEVLNKWADVS